MKALVVLVTRLYSPATTCHRQSRTTSIIARSVNAEDRGGSTLTKNVSGPPDRNPEESSSATSTAESGWGATLVTMALAL